MEASHALQSVRSVVERAFGLVMQNKGLLGFRAQDALQLSQMVDIAFALYNGNTWERQGRLKRLLDASKKKPLVAFERRIFSPSTYPSLHLKAAATKDEVKKMQKKFYGVPNVALKVLRKVNSVVIMRRAESLLESGYVLNVSFAEYGGFHIVHAKVAPSFCSFKYDVFLMISPANIFLKNICTCTAG